MNETREKFETWKKLHETNVLTQKAPQQVYEGKATANAWTVDSL
jgi:hypothetical protein